MNTLTKKVAIWYGLWVLLWLGVTVFGDAEFGISAFFYLTMTGLTFSLLGWNVTPHGELISILTVGAIGLIQWCLLVEVNAHITAWWKSRNKND